MGSLLVSWASEDIAAGSNVVFSFSFKKQSLKQLRRLCFWGLNQSFQPPQIKAKQKKKRQISLEIL